MCNSNKCQACFEQKLMKFQDQLSFKLQTIFERVCSSESFIYPATEAIQELVQWLLNIMEQKQQVPSESEMLLKDYKHAISNWYQMEVLENYSTVCASFI